MTQREATAWALYVSEIWYGLLDLAGRRFAKRRVYYRARGVVVFDRVMAEAAENE